MSRLGLAEPHGNFKLFIEETRLLMLHIINEAKHPNPSLSRSIEFGSNSNSKSASATSGTTSGESHHPELRPFTEDVDDDYVNVSKPEAPEDALIRRLGSVSLSQSTGNKLVMPVDPQRVGHSFPVNHSAGYPSKRHQFM